MTENVEKTISNLIQRDFPAYYREEGPVFVEFVKTYYQWLEQSNNSIYHARRLLEYGDVDETSEEFLVYFKEKYLKNIQFETQTNTRQLIKHTLDLYRSKGTERSIALLFALVFGETAEVYYPGDDLFRLSDGSWIKPTYLEVSTRETNINYVGKQIRGLSSGATAFVERLIRRKIRSKYIEVFYISAIKGNFQTNEKIICNGVTVDKAPFIVGSLTTFDLIDPGQGFEIGDIVNITSNNGVQAKGRVVDIETITGIVDFNLEDGGWGYTASAEVLISEKVLGLSNVQVRAFNSNTNYPLMPFESFETIIQPLCSLQYEYGTGTFVVNDDIRTYYSNGSVSGYGTVLSLATTNSTAGTLTLKVNSGNLAQNVVFYNSGNVITANTVASGWTDLTATANVMAWSTNVDVTIINASGMFSNGEQVVQTGLGNVIIATATVNTHITSVGANGIVKIVNANGVFKSDKLMHGLSSGVTANVQSLAFSIGVKDIDLEDFIITSNNAFYTPNNGTTGTVIRISSGTGASFGIANSLINTEEVRVDLDLVRDFIDVELDAAQYGLSGDITANSDDIILDSLGLANVVIGTITSINAENPGSNYDTAPYVTVFEPYIGVLRKHDYVFKITLTSGVFYEGEIVTQQVTGATAIVKSGSNNSVLYLERIGYNNIFNDVDPIVGDFSNATATIDENAEDYLSMPIGLNAVVSSNVTSGNGVIANLEVYDSGFGYLQDEIAGFVSEDGLRAGRVKLNLIKQGQSEGYYRDKGSFLSDNKYLHDGEYYQEYSYEVRSSITLNKYFDMLKQVVHVAGTKMFGGLVKKSVIETPITLASTIESTLSID
jgi:hypothetical protein